MHMKYSGFTVLSSSILFFFTVSCLFGNESGSQIFFKNNLLFPVYTYPSSYFFPFIRIFPFASDLEQLPGSSWFYNKHLSYQNLYCIKKPARFVWGSIRLLQIHVVRLDTVCSGATTATSIFRCSFLFAAFFLSLQMSYFCVKFFLAHLGWKTPWSAPGRNSCDHNDKKKKELQSRWQRWGFVLECTWLWLQLGVENLRRSHSAKKAYHRFPRSHVDGTYLHTGMRKNSPPRLLSAQFRAAETGSTAGPLTFCAAGCSILVDLRRWRTTSTAGHFPIFLIR